MEMAYAAGLERAAEIADYRAECLRTAVGMDACGQMSGCAKDIHAEKGKTYD